MNYPMRYPKIPDLMDYNRLIDYAKLKYELGSGREAIEQALGEVKAALEQSLSCLIALQEDQSLASLEPDTLEGIMALRPKGARELWTHFDESLYADRLAGAFIGRLAGCTLGAPVEGWQIDGMKEWAAYIGDAFPPRDYWSAVKSPGDKRCGASRYEDYTRPLMTSAPADDDTTYTLLGLLAAEEYGLGFTVDDIGKCWLKYLPFAYTAEDVALRNLKAGVCAGKAGEIGNPYIQWIGADIRSDPWAYMAPGLPEKAAGMAYRDAWLSHRRSGVYGAMYFSAVISAAFAVGDPVEALHLGLNEIPVGCRLAQDVRWALKTGPRIAGYAEANAAVRERFGEMSAVHTNVNACLTVFGLMIGKEDFTRCIGETVAMAYDNDCTAATVGSIFGAAKGIGKIPEYWYNRFHNKTITYLNGHQEFEIDDVLRRFTSLARAALNTIR